jgi:hypothetical protein
MFGVLDFYIVVFWVMILGCLVGGWYPATWCYNLEEHSRNLDYHESLKSYVDWILFVCVCVCVCAHVCVDRAFVTTEMQSKHTYSQIP